MVLFVVWKKEAGSSSMTRPRTVPKVNILKIRNILKDVNMTKDEDASKWTNTVWCQ